MRHHVFLHLSETPISEFRARWWIEIDNYLPEFPPFGKHQRFKEEEAKEILYYIMPNRWRSHMKHINFDVDDHSLSDIFDLMERYQIADQIDPPTKPSQAPSKTNTNDSNKSSTKSNDKKRKCKTTNSARSWCSCI